MSPKMIVVKDLWPHSRMSTQIHYDLPHMTVHYFGRYLNSCLSSPLASIITSLSGKHSSVPSCSISCLHNMYDFFFRLWRSLHHKIYVIYPSYIAVGSLLGSIHLRFSVFCNCGMKCHTNGPTENLVDFTLSSYLLLALSKPACSCLRMSA